MAFLGGLQGLGALAGGVGTGIGQGASLDQYIQNARAQGLAGNALSQAYTGQPAGGGGGLLAGLGNLFGGGQQASAPSAAPPLSGLSAAGQTPISSTADVPGLAAGQPGVANSNLVGGASIGSGPTSPFAQQQPSLSQPPPAQPQAQSDQTSQQGSQPAPFQTNASQGIGGQQQLTLPQFIQAARRVAPNASGRQIALAATELAKGGLLGYGAMTPYQAANLALQAGLKEAEISNIQSEIEKRKSDTANQAETQGRERDKEADTQADKGVTEAQTQLREATSALNENRQRQMQLRSDINTASIAGATTPEAKASVNDLQSELAKLQGEEKDRIGEEKAAKANLDKAKQERAAKAAKSYGTDTTRAGQPDYVQTPDGKMMHYKGTGPRDDPSSYEEVQ